MKPVAFGLAAVFFIIAVLYAVGVLNIGAHEVSPHHYKHAVLFAVLGALALVWARFQTNAKSAR
jgi:hypothetical protein